MDATLAEPHTVCCTPCAVAAGSTESVCGAEVTLGAMKVTMPVEGPTAR